MTDVVFATSVDSPLQARRARATAPSSRPRRGGVTFRMTGVGGETPDTALIRVPEEKAAFIGDDSYDSFPMLAPPRGSAPRPALEYVGALEKDLSLEPELLLPGTASRSSGRPR